MPAAAVTNGVQLLRKDIKVILERTYFLLCKIILWFIEVAEGLVPLQYKSSVSSSPTLASEDCRMQLKKSSYALLRILISSNTHIRRTLKESSYLVVEARNMNVIYQHTAGDKKNGAILYLRRYVPRVHCMLKHFCFAPTD